MKANSPFPLGAFYQDPRRCSFQLWAPHISKAAVRLRSPCERLVPLARSELGYHSALVDDIAPGSTYFFRLDERTDRPDPASRHQPQGVHGPSEVVDPAFAWEDHEWFGLPLRDYILYELHVGTFTPEGTFDAIIPHLPALRDLGITALELMPVAQFPGTRNWGYDGAYPFAVQNSYGGPPGLKRLANACHRAGLALVLDVVYNHLGPEGNYLHDFGPYFTDRYHTGWGLGLNFDGPHSDEVRRFFLENALYWQTDFHIDALRLDAVHAIRDASATPFLLDLARATRRQAERLNRRFHLIAESDLNNPRIISPESLGGLGLDAQWTDDFHHCLHVLLTGERDGYYQDFGGLAQLAKVFREGYAYTGQYSPYRKQRQGNSPRFISSRQFVVYAQNHDQIGNRCHGDRLGRLVSFSGQKLAAATVLLSPFIPLLFMGEEYGETAPFQYVISHTDPELVDAVRQGRCEEFTRFAWADPVPDPQAEATFLECVLHLDWTREGKHHGLLRSFYRELIRLRKSVSAIAEADKPTIEAHAFETERIVSLHYWTETSAAYLVLCFATAPVEHIVELPAGTWVKLLDSSAPAWGGPGTSLPDRILAPGRATLRQNPESMALYESLADPL